MPSNPTIYWTRAYCQNAAILGLPSDKNTLIIPYMRINKPKIVVILGPTASGKSDVAIRLAQRFNGEIISADSRQVYRGMDIGSGKVTKMEQQLAPHWMLDVVSPRTNYSAAQFQRKAKKILKDILRRKKLPIICGGTGFWIQSIVDDITYPEVKPNWKLRNSLSNLSTDELFEKLRKIDPERANTIDPRNKVRLIRAIEICETLGNVPRPDQGAKSMQYNFFQIGIIWPRDELYQRIENRLDQRFQEGMIEEVKRLHEKNKISWKRMEELGLEYRWITKFLKKEIRFEEMRDRLLLEIKHYAKRQITWFKKDARIKWFSEYGPIEKEVEKFVENN
jgi:tRNA dimethylallyltransferase